MVALQDLGLDSFQGGPLLKDPFLRGLEKIPSRAEVRRARNEVDRDFGRVALDVEADHPGLLTIDASDEQLSIRIP